MVGRGIGGTILEISKNNKNRMLNLDLLLSILFGCLNVIIGLVMGTLGLILKSASKKDKEKKEKDEPSALDKFKEWITTLCKCAKTPPDASPPTPRSG